MEHLFDRRAQWALLGVLLVSSGTSASAADLNLICSGNSYKNAVPFPTEETVSLKISDAKSASILLPGASQPINAKTDSDNQFQLKFSAADLTGEYFYFSGDLFLIHKDGRFTRLFCRPA